MNRRFRFVLALSLVMSLLLMTAGTAAAFPPEFGISQSYRDFGYNGNTGAYNPYDDVSRSIYWGPLNIKRLRVVVPWDIAERKASDPRRAEFQHWLDRANELEAEPFVVFGPTERTTSSDEVHTPAHYSPLTTYDATNQHFIAPPGSTYKIAIQDFFATWGPKTPYDVEEIGAWNEPNRGSFTMAIPPQLTGQVYLPTNEYAMNDISHCPSGATNNNCGPLLAAWYWEHAVEAAAEVCGGSFCKIAAGEFASSAGTFTNGDAWQYWNTYGNKIKAINKYIPGVISFHAHRDAEELGNNITESGENHDCKSGQTQWCVTTTFRNWMNSFGWSSLMDVWNTETGARYLSGTSPSSPDTAQNNRFNWLIQISDEANVKRLYYFNFQGGGTDRGLIDSGSGVDTRNRPIWNTVRCRNGCSTWTPPPAPTVQTTAASSVQTTSVTLNGTVNPNGANTSYHFEYGTADCASNPCTKTPASDAYVGNGTSAVAESVTVTGLQPGTTYHYRILASSSRGTSPGSDQVFTTSPSRPVALVGPGSQQAFYYHGSDGALWQGIFSNGKWNFQRLGGSIAGDPSPVVGPGSQQAVYYRGSDGTITQAIWDSTAFQWKFFPLCGAAAGDPAAVVGPETQQAFYYRGSDGALWQGIFSNGKWTCQRLGGSIAGDPSPVVGPGSQQAVYYRGSDGTITQAIWDSTAFQWKFWGLAANATSDPSAVLGPSTQQAFYYRGSNRTVWQAIWGGTQWSAWDLGGG